MGARWSLAGAAVICAGTSVLGFLIAALAVSGDRRKRYFEDYPWQMIAPGLCIACTVLAINLLGDGLRDVADPRTR